VLGVALPTYIPWSQQRFDDRRQQARATASQPLVPLALVLVVGIALDRAAAPGGYWAAIGAIGVIGWWIASRRDAWRWGTVGLLLGFAAMGGAWHHAHWRWFDVAEVGRFAPLESTPICLEGVATDAPIRQGSPAPTALRAIPQGEKTQVRLRVTRLRDGDDWRGLSGNIDLIVDGHLLAVHVGDRLRVFGQIRRSSQPRNPGQFDFAADARADRSLARVRCQSPDCVRRLESGSRFSPWRWLADTRVAIEQTLWRQLGHRRAPIAAAMLVGARQGVSRDRAETYRRTGTLHVLVVSGLHVGLVVGLFYVAARIGWFPRRGTLLVVMVLIAAYALLAGARPPVVRAAVLAEMICLSAICGRQVLAINSLAAATLVVLCYSPAELFRSGPQLSFIAAATLIWFGNRQLDRRKPDPMARLLASVRPLHARFVRALASWAGLVLLATLAVWITTAPLLATRFNLLSPVALPISLAVFPLVSIAVVAGLLLVTVGGIAPPAAPLLAGCCGWAIDTLQWAVDVAHAAPGGSIWTPGPYAWWTIGAYVLLATGLVLGSRPRVAIRLTQLGLAWIAVGFLSAIASDHRPAGLRCTFIDVGHGCSVLVETPTGQTLLYDAGSLGSPSAASETIAGVLWNKGIQRIDALVLSHADVDHFNATPGLLDRFAVAGVYVSQTMFAEVAPEKPFSGPAELHRSLIRSATPLFELRQGDQLTLGDAAAKVYHPIDGDTGGSDNSRSLVLAVEFDGRRVLLPGDLEAPGLDDLITQAPYDCDLLLAPHHGSARSDPPGFASWSQPEWVVVSGGIGADTASAGASYTAAGANVLRTANSGMIEVVLDAQAISVTRYLQTDATHHTLGNASIKRPAGSEPE